MQSFSTMGSNQSETLESLSSNSLATESDVLSSLDSLSSISTLSAVSNSTLTSFAD